MAYNMDMHDYWQKQAADKPLFPDLLWSRPENRTYAGKLLIVGGNAYGFAAPAEGFAAAEQAGIGVARVLLPDSLQKTVGKVFEAGEYAPSTPSGSFSQRALAELLSLAGWADGVLLDGDMGRNSETAILLEKFAGKYGGQLTLSGDAADYFIPLPTDILYRPQTLLVLSFSQLQKLFTQAHFPHAITSSMDRIRLVQTLHLFSLQHRAYLILSHDGMTFVAVEGRVSSTAWSQRQEPSSSRLAAAAAVWWLQQSVRPYEALTTSLTSS
jgi:hypothetical protein